MLSSTVSATSYGSETDTPHRSGASSSITVPDENIISSICYTAKRLSHIHQSQDLPSDYSIEETNYNTTQTDFGRAYQRHAQTSHMGILDPTYECFSSQHGYGSFLFKVRARTVIVSGDLLCPESCRELLLDEFRHSHKTRGLALTIVGASGEFAKWAEDQGWVTICFGRETILDPLSNEVLQKKAGKRMLGQNRQLIDPKRGGISVHLYTPSITGVDSDLEDRLQTLYDTWRYGRNQDGRNSYQVFVTIYKLFSFRESTTLLYTTDRDGNINGLATLRALGTQVGFHLDPCIASADAPRGITDLLVITAMELLKSAQIGYLSLGFEPFDNIQEIHGQSKIKSRLWKSGYNHMIKQVPVEGKATYFRKFHPDNTLASELFICIPSKSLQLRESFALLRFANMNIRQLLTPLRPMKAVHSAKKVGIKDIRDPPTHQCPV